jgi:hypothetical protein
LRYVNDDRLGLGTYDYRDDCQEWDGVREICGPCTKFHCF